MMELTSLMVQGNILKGFNKDHVRFIFFNIVDAHKAANLFRELVNSKKIPIYLLIYWMLQEI